MLDRQDLTEEEYRKYRVPAFPKLSQPAEFAGFNQTAFLMALAGGWLMFLLLETMLLPGLVAVVVLILVDFYLRKDPQWLILAPKLRHVKVFNGSWYRESQLPKGGRKVMRIKFVP